MYVGEKIILKKKRGGGGQKYHILGKYSPHFPKSIFSFQDGQNELIVGSEDYEIRVFADDEIIAGLSGYSQ